MVGSFVLSPRIRTPSINPGEIIEVEVFFTGIGDVPTDIKLNTSYPASILKTDENGYVGVAQTCVIVGKNRNNKIGSIATGNTKLTDSKTGETKSAIQKFPQTRTGSTFTLNEGFFLSSQTLSQLQGKKIDVRDKSIVGERSWDGHPPIYIKLNTSADAPSGDYELKLTLFYHDGNKVQTNQKDVVVHIKDEIEQRARSLSRNELIEPNFVKSFVSFLRSHNWHRLLLPVISVFLDSKHTDIDFDNFLMAITKIVETNVRSSIQRHQASATRSKEVGIRLLDSAVHCHLIKNKEETLYALLFWILKEPRNLHHHEFRIHPIKNIILYTLTVDHALFEMEKLMQSTYRGEFQAEINTKNKEFLVYNVKVYDHNNNDITDDIKLEANFTFSNGKVGETELGSNGEGNTFGRYNYRGNAAGTLRVELAGVTESSRITMTSGTTLYLSPNIKQCSHCGETIGDSDWRCQSCGERFYVY